MYFFLRVLDDFVHKSFAKFSFTLSVLECIVNQKRKSFLEKKKAKLFGVVYLRNNTEATGAKKAIKKGMQLKLRLLRHRGKG